MTDMAERVALRKQTPNADIPVAVVPPEVHAQTGAQGLRLLLLSTDGIAKTKALHSDITPENLLIIQQILDDEDLRPGADSKQWQSIWFDRNSAGWSVAWKYTRDGGESQTALVSQDKSKGAEAAVVVAPVGRRTPSAAWTGRQMIQVPPRA